MLPNTFHVVSIFRNLVHLQFTSAAEHQLDSSVLAQMSYYLYFCSYFIR